MSELTASHGATVARVRAEVEAVFAELAGWFDKPEPVRQYRPADSGWTIDEVLEHITLTSHFLLIVIRKNCDKAVKRAQRGEQPSENESDLELLQPVGLWGSFVWIRPEHMEPTGAVPLAEVRVRMAAQRDECLDVLQRLKSGEGALVKVRMSVNECGHLDIYQWIAFLALHARRHLTQLQGNEDEFRARGCP